MKNIFLPIILLIFINGCKEKYDSPYESPDTGYLVVEGAIYSGPGKTTLKLSRSVKLDDKTYVYETGAKLRVEGNDNSAYNLIEDVKGTYIASNLPLSSNQQYRLRILTNNGKEYLSDYVSVIPNPEIDSIPWVMENDGLQLFVDTHNPQNNTRYYQWEYIETWKFQSQYPSYLKLQITDQNYSVVPINPTTNMPDTSVYTCWQSDTSSSLLLGSSAKLSEDVIHLPIHFIEAGSQKLGIMYSIIVVQNALSKEAYEFLEKMKKNTEQLGSIFDPQPSQLSGNIHCVSDPSELVVGFVHISNYVEKRIFIAKDDLPAWVYKPVCNPVEILNVSDSIRDQSNGRYPAYISLAAIGPNPATVLFAEHECIDCTLTGTNKKPAFWP
jgi:Domain of unknown function (DUF4249)